MVFSSKPCFRRVDGFNTKQFVSPCESISPLFEIGDFMDDGAAASHCAWGPKKGPNTGGLDTSVPWAMHHLGHVLQTPSRGSEFKFRVMTTPKLGWFDVVCC